MVKKTFRPEFLNRIDELIMFTPLSEKEIREIVRLQLNHVISQLAGIDIKLSITDPAIDLIAEQGFDPQYGARPIKRLIQKVILNELSRQILEGKIKKDQEVQIGRDKTRNYNIRFELTDLCKTIKTLIKSGIEFKNVVQLK